MFTAYQISNGDIKNKEHLNNNEVDQWMSMAYGKFATVKVTHDLTGKYVVYTDDGHKFIPVEKGVM